MSIYWRIYIYITIHNQHTWNCWQLPLKLIQLTAWKLHPSNQHPAASGTERVVVAILWIHQLWETWYLQCFWHLGKHKMPSVFWGKIVLIFLGVRKTKHFVLNMQQQLFYLSSVTLNSHEFLFPYSPESIKFLSSSHKQVRDMRPRESPLPGFSEVKSHFSCFEECQKNNFWNKLFYLNCLTFELARILSSFTWAWVRFQQPQAG